ncbi:MAG: hypothetical protein ACPL1G_03430 [Thermodesulfovibrionales bacterium]
MEGRQPISRLLGPSLKGMFRATNGYEIANRVVQQEMEGKFNKHLKDEMYLVSKRRG